MNSKPASAATSPLQEVVPGSPTTAQTLRLAAQKWPDQLACILGSQRLTYSQLYEQSLLYARALTAMGARRGSHIGILMPNSVDYILLFYAAGLVGATALTINARFKEDDLAYVIGTSDVEFLFIGGHALPYQDFSTTLRGLYPELRTWSGNGALALASAPNLKAIVNFSDPREKSWPDRDRFLAGAQSVPPETAESASERISESDVALVMYSSGTTARPKACMLTHRSLGMTGAALAKRFRLSTADRFYNPMPFFHMSMMLPLAACRASGATHIATMHFEPGEGLEIMEREKATVAYVSFPAVISQLIGHPTFRDRDLASLRIVHSVGPVDLLRRYAAAFPQAYFVNAYGLTEATGVPVYSDLDDPQEISLIVGGRPFEGVEAKAVDPDTLEDVADGERGEIWLRGYCVFAGYYKEPEATKGVLQPDGWLRSGDLGSIDPDGRVVYSGRLKDMLKIGGENVAALEIENYLCSHPQVAIAQVIAVADEHLTEVAAAFVELKPGSRLTAQDLARYCIGQIASYKIPRYIRFVTEWPMSTTKIQKFKLADQFVPVDKIDVKALASEKM